MGLLPADSRLGAIRLRAGDVERLRAFYETTIGLEALGADDGITTLGVDGSPLVELVSDPARRPVRRGRRGCSTSRSSCRRVPTSHGRSVGSPIRAGR